MLSIFHKLLNFYQEKVKKTPKEVNENPKKSKIYALERLKECHNYDYATFVSKFLKKQNYIVWEYSKERNLIDHKINLVLKKDNDILLVQCKNNYSYISINDIKLFEETVQEFILKYKMFKNYNIILYYIFPEYQFDEAASTYVASCKNIDFKILKEHTDL